MIGSLYGTERSPFLGTFPAMYGSPAYPDGSVVKSQSSVSVWLLESPVRRGFPDWNTFLASGYTAPNIHTVSDAYLAAIPIGLELPIIPSTTPTQPSAATGDDAIATSALAWTSSIGMSASLYASWKAQVMAALAAGILDPGGQYANSSGKCAGASAPATQNDLNMAGQSLGMAGSAATAGALIAGAGSVIPFIGIGVAAGTLFITLLKKLFGPPVSQLEEQKLCPAVSAANAVLTQILNELKAGAITSSQASSAINSLRGQFASAVSSIEYIQTPNDTQLILASLDALITKNTQSGGVYDQLGTQAKSALAAQQQAQQTAQAAEIQQAAQAAVNVALAKANPPATAQTAATPVTTTPAPASVPAGPAVTAAPAASTSFFSKEITIGKYQIPDWALLLGAGLLLVGAM
jgi:hypothetical protein